MEKRVPTLQETIDIVKEHAEEWINDKQEEWPPAAYVLTATHLNVLIIADMTDDVKAVWSDFFPNVLRKFNALSYVLTFEAWMAMGLDKESSTLDRIFRGEVRISELPLDDRKETFCLIICEKGKEARMISAEIKHLPRFQRQLGEWKNYSEKDGYSSGERSIKEG